MKVKLVFFILFVALLFPNGVQAAAGLSVSSPPGFNVSTLTAGDPLQLNITANIGSSEATSNGGAFFQILTGGVRGDITNPNDSSAICQLLQNGGANAGLYGNYVFALESGSAFTLVDTIQGNSQSDTDTSIHQTFNFNATPGQLRVYSLLIKYPLPLYQEAGSPGYRSFINSVPSCANMGNGTASQIVHMVARSYTIAVDATGQPQVQDNGNTGGGAGSSTSAPLAPLNIDVSGAGVLDMQNVNAAQAGSIDCPNLRVALPGNLGIIDFDQANILGLCNSRPILVNLINLMLIIASITFVVAVIYSGIMLVQSDSEEGAATAKKNLTWAVIGAIITISANWIVPFIINLWRSGL